MRMENLLFNITLTNCKKYPQTLTKSYQAPHLELRTSSSSSNIDETTLVIASYRMFSHSPTKVPCSSLSVKSELFTRTSACGFSPLRGASSDHFSMRSGIVIHGIIRMCPNEWCKRHCTTSCRVIHTPLLQLKSPCQVLPTRAYNITEPHLKGTVEEILQEAKHSPRNLHTNWGPSCTCSANWESSEKNAFLYCPIVQFPQACAKCNWWEEVIPTLWSFLWTIRSEMVTCMTLHSRFCKWTFPWNYIYSYYIDISPRTAKWRKLSSLTNAALRWPWTYLLRLLLAPLNLRRIQNTVD